MPAVRSFFSHSSSAPGLARGSRLTVDLGRLVALGALNPALGYALGLFGLVTVSASLAVLVWAIEPVIVVLLAVPLLAERPEQRGAALVLVAVAGALLVLRGLQPVVSSVASS